MKPNGVFIIFIKNAKGNEYKTKWMKEDDDHFNEFFRFFSLVIIIVLMVFETISNQMWRKPNPLLNPMAPGRVVVILKV